ncbi:aminoglycoside phosphotransferase family protein, partial [Escherichia coli]|nr:aminoglycoside phosphotransferase family protein [Escherichia coli]MED8428658.1 aminoglycoside phosphotransferase family protein [Escherichia coli]
MPAFEWVHVQLHQQKGMISLSPPTICNSAPAIVKGLKPIEDIADELRGADYLVWRNGRGAVRLLGR